MLIFFSLFSACSDDSCKWLLLWCATISLVIMSAGFSVVGMYLRFIVPVCNRSPPQWILSYVSCLWFDFSSVVSREWSVHLLRNIFVGRHVSVELHVLCISASFPRKSSFRFQRLNISQENFLIHDTYFANIYSSMYSYSPLYVSIINWNFLFHGTGDTLMPIMFPEMYFRVLCPRPSRRRQILTVTFLWRG